MLIAVITFLRIFNLNYNSPFNDEAIYIVVGKMGLLENDFVTFGARSWMAGSPLVYPIMTSLVFQTGGITASRLLNIMFSLLIVEEVFILTRHLNLFSKKINQTAAYLAVIIAGFSGVGIYSSRLATYDIPSFFLLIFSINEMIKAGKTSTGKHYFLSALGLLLSYFCKIVTAIYFPFIVVASYIFTRKYQKQNLHIWFKYFLIPLLSGFAVYLVFDMESLKAYVSGQIDYEIYPLTEIIETIWNDMKLVLIFGLISAIILILKKKFYAASMLVFLASVLPAFHLYYHRFTTLDKHLYFSVVFLSPIIGYGLSYIIHSQSFPSIFLKATAYYGILYFLVSSIITFKQLEHSWPDTTMIDSFLSENSKQGDKILTQAGASTMLALYEKNHPVNITTFDWINYSGFTDENGYLQAVKDKYFQYIELNTADDTPKKESLREILLPEVEKQYNLVYQVGDFSIYEKK